MPGQKPEARDRYYEENQEEILRRQREHYEANREAIAARRKERYAANREALLAKQKEYRDRPLTEEERIKRRLLKREQNRRFRESNPSAYKAAKKRSNDKRDRSGSLVSEKRRYVAEYKTAHPCTCGESDIVCLQFHHRNPSEKRFAIGNLLMSGERAVPLSDVIAEIAKCDVLCANCHMKLHAREREKRRPSPPS